MKLDPEDPRDPIQQVIDRQAWGCCAFWAMPPTQKNCHAEGILEEEILSAIDEKTQYGDYAEG